ncbi:uncharacterized protein [Battus philenor]|uniref:uncharacterized protein n=1 Tax=Battus philenor TaxID=42288 RepID=UPI0035CF37E1
MVAPVLAAGIPLLGVAPYEPLYMNEISGEASKLIYHISDSKVTGLSKCVVSNVKFNFEELKYDLYCPSLVVTGHMEVSGELLDIPVEGNGEFKIITDQTLINVEAKMEKYTGDDGKLHLVSKNFKANTPQKPVEVSFDSLKPKNDLPPNVAKLFEEKKFTKGIELLTPAFIQELYNVVFISLNKFLEAVPLDELFID